MDNNRKKLNKLLGKKLEYTAVFKKYNGDKALLTEVCYKGKSYTDHAWVSYHNTLRGFKIKTKIAFYATATTYTDSHGVRKNGLNRCHRYRVDEEAFDIVKHDNEQRYLRGKKR